ncbi:hypothetical protein WJM97_11195 [Okeanomitos corallinicola TIOX110]|uniref:Secreted protein n=1 Tax=Okeanomitos corallinicola TIOX110 TaxID=3133117 RepID=A0ABZ2UKT4_9CYAN
MLLGVTVGVVGVTGKEGVLVFSATGCDLLLLSLRGCNTHPTNPDKRIRFSRSSSKATGFAIPSFIHKIDQYWDIHLTLFREA